MWTLVLKLLNALLDSELARKVFDEMPERSVISWSCMIAWYSHVNLPQEALQLFLEMVVAGVKPIDATLASGQSACAQNGCLELGRWICIPIKFDEKRMKFSAKMSMNS